MAPGPGFRSTGGEEVTIFGPDEADIAGSRSDGGRRQVTLSMAAFRDACAPHFELHVVPAADQPEARRSPEVHIYRLRKHAAQKKRRRERG